MTHQLTLRRLLAGLGLSSVLFAAGCSDIIGPPKASQLYYMQPVYAAAPQGPMAPYSLAVARPDTPESLDNDRLALTKSDTLMDYYADTQMREQVPVIVQRSLIEALDKTGRVAQVAREETGLRSDYLLQTDLRDFSAHYAVIDTPPQVTVQLTARMVRLPGRQVIGTLTVEKSAPTDSNSVPAVIHAFNQALGAAASDIAAWALTAPPPAPAQGAVSTPPAAAAPDRSRRAPPSVLGSGSAAVTRGNFRGESSVQQGNTP